MSEGAHGTAPPGTSWFRPPGRATRRGGSRTVFLVFLLAVGVRLLPLPTVMPLVTRSMERGFADDGAAYYIPLADGIIERGELAIVPGKPSAFWMPLYPLLLAGIRVLGFRGLEDVIVMQALLGGLALFLLGLFVRDWAGERVALVAVLLAALLPDFAVYSYLNLSENLSMVLFLLTCILLQRGLSSPSLGWWVGAGFSLGLAALTREFCGTLVVPFSVLAMQGHGMRRGALRAVLLASCCAVALAPWTWRNYVALGLFRPLSNKGPVNLYVATLKGGHHPSDDRQQWKLEDPRQAEADRILKEKLALAPTPDEKRRLYRQAAWRNYVEDPLGQLGYLGRKVLFFWEPNVGVRHGERLGLGSLLLLSDLMYYACLGLAAGAFLLPRPPHMGAFLAATTAWTMAFHLLVGEAESRYHFILLPGLLAFAALCLARLLKFAPAPPGGAWEPRVGQA